MKHHIFVKFLAVFLCACTLLCCVLSGVGIALTASLGLYGTDVEGLYRQRLENDLLRLSEVIATRYAAAALSNCPAEFINIYTDNRYARLLDETLYAYRLEDENAQVLELNYDAERFAGAETYEFLVRTEYPVIMDYSVTDDRGFSAESLLPTVPTVPPVTVVHPAEGEPATYYETFWWHDEDTGLDHRYELAMHRTPLYLVTLYLLPGAYERETGPEWTLMELAHSYRFWMIGILCVGLLLFAGSLVYLCCAAGKKPGSAEIRPGGINRLPLDLYAAVTCTAAVCLTVAAVECIDILENYWIPGAVAYGLGGLLGCLLIVGFLFAIAAQSKLPGFWWRHTLVGLVITGCGNLVRKCGRGIARFFRGCGRLLHRGLCLLPMVWQWVALIGIGLLLGIWAFAIASEELLIFALIFCLLVAAYVVFAYGLLMEGARRMSQGNLNNKISTRFLVGCFRDFAVHLNTLADVAVIAAQKQMKSERMKAELVTNVSHDIKTPLTSIINYVDLLQNTTDRGEMDQYLEVLGRQSQRMKKLIEDLMEMSKASTGNLSVEITQVDAAEAVNQALGEFSDKLDAARLTPIFHAPEDPVPILADGRLAWRVLSNLLSNAVKYALPGTRLYVDLVTLEDQVLISLKNISREQLNVSSDELTERFVRGDASRNTEGSGLGLNIARSLMELQHGSLQLLVDGDLFKVTLLFPRVDL